jgi:hypothetical protein
LAGSLGLISGALAEQACGGLGNYCDGTGASEVCFIYSPEPFDAGMPAVLKDAGHDAGPPPDGGVDAYVPWAPGDGGGCFAAPGAFTSPTCDPSDEMAPGCGGGVDSGCGKIDPKCGDPTTCEPFIKNPPPDMGVDTFRMRLINLNAPPVLAKSPAIQGTIVTAGVDLPATPSSIQPVAAACGENGEGLFNWIMRVDKHADGGASIVTGGAPPSSDPFDVGYCFLRGHVGGTPIAPVTLPITFLPSSNTFSSQPYPGTINIPIFLPPKDGGPLSAVILPISALAVSDTTISDDGQCIGAVNNNGSSKQASGQCANTTPVGQQACARWHSAGSFAGYITLRAADSVPVEALGGGSLCVLLTQMSNGENPPKCSAAGLTAGDYCSGPNGTLGTPGGCKDSMWLAAEFAASAVKVTPDDVDSGVPLCNGGTL